MKSHIVSFSSHSDLVIATCSAARSYVAPALADIGPRQHYFEDKQSVLFWNDSGFRRIVPVCVVELDEQLWTIASALFHSSLVKLHSDQLVTPRLAGRVIQHQRNGHRKKIIPLERYH